MEVFTFCRVENFRPGLLEVDGNHEARKARTRMRGLGGGLDSPSECTSGFTRLAQILLEVRAFLVKMNFGEWEEWACRAKMVLSAHPWEILHRRETTTEAERLPSWALTAAQQQLRIGHWKTPWFISKELEPPQCPSSSCVTFNPPSPLYPVKQG